MDGTDRGWTVFEKPSIPGSCHPLDRNCAALIGEVCRPRQPGAAARELNGTSRQRHAAMVVAGRSESQPPRSGAPIERGGPRRQEDARGIRRRFLGEKLARARSASSGVAGSYLVVAASMGSFYCSKFHRSGGVLCKIKSPSQRARLQQWRSTLQVQT